MARSLTALLLVVLGLPALASAERGFRHGRIRHADYGATVQRGTETNSEEAVANLPYLPGDRVWTDGNARVEFQFTGGSTLRLDRGSKLDYVAHDDSRHERFVLRLWSGGLYVRTDKRDGVFEIETPGGVVTSEGRGVLRIDAEAGETRLSVYEGDARLDDQKVEAGERVYARDGRVDEPGGFDRTESDDFAAWDEELEAQVAYAAHEQRLPEELSIYERELDSQGVWYHEASIGQTVWRPHVGVGWRPYLEGRWTWTPYGWTWVAGERWGWATSHYGRWGYSPAGSWYWMPSTGWGPGWVSWAVGGDYVGWCPMGWGNRPVIINNVTVVNNHRGRGRGHGSRDTWTYARRGDMGSRDLARRRTDRIDPTIVRELRVIDNPHQRLARDFTVTAPRAAAQVPGGATEGDARAMPRQRAVRTKPTMADTVPELRADPMTTIPLPIPRRRTRAEETDSKDGEATPENSRLRSLPRRHSTTPSAEAAAPSDAHPTDARTPVNRRGFDASTSTGERTRRRHASDEANAPASPPAPDSGRARERSRDRDENADRDVLRPIFRPLSRPRTDDGGASAGSSHRSEPRREPRSEPRTEPRSAPRPERSEPRAQPAAPPQTKAPADASSGQGRARRRDNN